MMSVERNLLKLFQNPAESWENSQMFNRLPAKELTVAKGKQSLVNCLAIRTW